MNRDEYMLFVWEYRETSRGGKLGNTFFTDWGAIFDGGGELLSVLN